MYTDKMTLYQKLTIVGFVFVILFMGATSWYGYTRLSSVSIKIAQLDTKISSTALLLQNALQKDKKNIQMQLGGVQKKIGSLRGTVTSIQKLNKIDPELLAKDSSVFFLSDNYVPAQLVDIPPKYEYSEKHQLQIIPEVLPRLEKMLDRAKVDGIALYVMSAYRSFNTQKLLKKNYNAVYGTNAANQFSAEQGYSEHQLGTTVDLMTTGIKGELMGFGNTSAYSWALENAYRYGFILSYPKHNIYYIFEPWHWRFVGIKLATYLHNSDTEFYKMNQHTIDKYLISIFD